MSQKGDVTEIWRTVLTEMEKNFNNVANQAMGSREFSRAMNQVGGASLGMQKAFGDLIERYLAGMNLPSRAQLESVGERLRGIEEQLRDIKAFMEDARRGGSDASGSAAGVASAPRPARTKRPSSTGAKQS